jgi:UDP-hydrolysing UDP-N-acetyl-D-glucosamine 2-epimerase
MDIVVFSGSRADRGPLNRVADVLDAHAVKLTEHKADTPVQVATATALIMDEVAVYLSNRAKPDFAIILGDRWDALACAVAIYLVGIPLVHLSGGDITEGSQDDSMRHAITKLAHIHFPTHTVSAKRILQMGEESWRVHTVGCPSIDLLQHLPLLSKKAVLDKLGVAEPYVLVAYQPETLAVDPVVEAKIFLDALHDLQLPCVFTTVNADVGSIGIQREFERFCVRGRGVILDMPRILYLSVMKHCQVMIGNSSSGLYEAPTLKVPFVNVGWRQAGRENATNVRWTPNEPVAIRRAVADVLRRDLRDTVNPYGDGHAAERIKDLLTTKFSQIPRQQLLTKKFVEADE